jgi:hypothetical protein
MSIIFEERVCPWYSSSIRVNGAMAQAPTQLTHSSVNSPSAVVPLRLTFSSRSSVSRICGAPLRWQAVPVQTLMVCLPRGEGEGLVEGAHGVDLARRDLHDLAQAAYAVLGDIVELALEVLQDGQQRFLRLFVTLYDVVVLSRVRHAINPLR